MIDGATEELSVVELVCILLPHLRDVMGSRMLMAASKSSARIQGRDGSNAARMHAAIMGCSRFSGEAPEKPCDASSMKSGE
jgi:hypothetical protein